MTSEKSIQGAIDRAFGKSAYSSAWEPSGDAQLLATEVKRLEDLHRPRDTRKGEWPEEGESILRWTDSIGFWFGDRARDGVDIGIWLPAPPSPEDEA